MYLCIIIVETDQSYRVIHVVIFHSELSDAIYRIDQKFAVPIKRVTYCTKQKFPIQFKLNLRISGRAFIAEKLPYLNFD
jgi:hypothetical protein